MANPLTRASTILVVEDQEEVRQIIARWLRRGGYAVIEAADGQQAIDMMARGLRVDMLVADVVMPRLGGLQLAIYLASRPEPRPALLFISGYDQEDRKLPGPFLRKPFNPETLVAEVDRLMISHAHQFLTAPADSD